MLIPDNVENFNSKGEELLFIKFKNDSMARSYYVLHSVFTNFHLRGPSGELDFLVLVPGHGFFAIEVKHGRVRREGGLWHYQNRHGITTRDSKGPFAQVNSTMNSIREYVLRKAGRDPKLESRLIKVLFGTGVAFTGLEKAPPDMGPESFPWQVLTREFMKLPISSYLNTISAGWHSEYRGKTWYDANYSRPTAEDCRSVIQILRGDFDFDYSEINKIVDHENLIEEYTNEQFKLLDFINYNNRCLVQGPAGTGKTLMALEVARRKLALGQKVGVFCFNQLLGDRLKEAVNKLSPKAVTYFAGTLHSFLVQHSDCKFNEETDSKYFSEDLPFQFLIECEDWGDNQKFDFIIVDEAQDLITEYYLEVFNAITKGGMRNGNWIFLGDFCNQAIYLNEPERSLSLLSEKASFTNFPPLKRNCRNTKKIAIQNVLLTGASRPEFTNRNIEGLPIDVRFVLEKSQRKEVEIIVRDLINGKIDIKRVTLLSPKKYDNTFLTDSSLLNGLMVSGDLSFHTIQSYKGLENTYIILCDFDKIDSKEAQQLLYVGISRARLKLFVVLSQSLKESYKNLVQRNLHLTA